jgi:transcriptional regulator with XRE-family HTH domain
MNAPKTPSAFAGRLKKLRTSASISARRLDELAGITQGHTSNIERGVFERVTTSTALALADVLGASLDYLIAGRGAAPAPAEVRSALRNAERREQRRKGSAAA